MSTHECKNFVPMCVSIKPANLILSRSQFSVWFHQCIGWLRCFIEKSNEAKESQERKAARVKMWSVREMYRIALRHDITGGEKHLCAPIDFLQRHWIEWGTRTDRRVEMVTDEFEIGNPSLMKPLWFPKFRGSLASILYDFFSLLPSNWAKLSSLQLCKFTL